MICKMYDNLFLPNLPKIQSSTKFDAIYIYVYHVSDFCFHPLNSKILCYLKAFQLPQNYNPSVIINVVNRFD